MRVGDSGRSSRPTSLALWSGKPRPGPRCPRLLRHTQLHICWNSSVSLEAAQMGVYSAMLDPRLRHAGPVGEYYADHRRTGMIQTVDDDAAAIESWIDRHLGRTAPIEDFAVFDARYARLLDFLTDQGDAHEHA